MGLSITINDNGQIAQYTLATASGWDLFTKWVESLPKGRFAHLSYFCQNGEVRGTNYLAQEIASAVRQYPPQNKGVKSTAQTLLGELGVGENKEIVTVTD